MPLLAGLLAQYAPLPLRLAYLVEVALLPTALCAVIATLPRRLERTDWRPRRPTIPAQIRRAFAVASTSAFVAWGVTGLFLALIPTVVTMTLGERNLALAGGVVALMLGRPP
jgi:hypothetical protein